MPAQARAFIFDMDGTLVDNMAFHERAWFELLGQYGLVLSSRKFHGLTAGKTTGDIIRLLLGDQIQPAKLEQEILRIGAEKENYYQKIYRRHLVPIPGLLDFLQKVKTRHIYTALATSARPGNVKFVLEGLGLKDYFDLQLTADDIQKSKPHPEIFLTAAGWLKIAPEDCVVFEDSLAGVEAASRAGMRVVGVKTTLSDEQFNKSKAVIQVIANYLGLDPGFF